jgi:hypothetical protein
MHRENNPAPPRRTNTSGFLNPDKKRPPEQHDLREKDKRLRTQESSSHHYANRNPTFDSRTPASQRNANDRPGHYSSSSSSSSSSREPIDSYRPNREIDLNRQLQPAEKYREHDKCQSEKKATSASSQEKTTKTQKPSDLTAQSSDEEIANKIFYHLNHGAHFYNMQFLNTINNVNDRSELCTYLNQLNDKNCNAKSASYFLLPLKKHCPNVIILLFIKLQQNRFQFNLDILKQFAKIIPNNLLDDNFLTHFLKVIINGKNDILYKELFIQLHKIELKTIETSEKTVSAGKMIFDHRMNQKTSNDFLSLNGYLLYSMIWLCNKCNSCVIAKEVYEKHKKSSFNDLNILSNFMQIAITDNDSKAAKKAHDEYNFIDYPLPSRNASNDEKKEYEKYKKHRGDVSIQYVIALGKLNELETAAKHFKQVCTRKNFLIPKSHKFMIANAYFDGCLNNEAFEQLEEGIDYLIKEDCIENKIFGLCVKKCLQNKNPAAGQSAKKIFFKAHQAGYVDAILLDSIVNATINADVDNIILYWQAGMDCNVQNIYKLAIHSIEELRKRKKPEALADAKKIYLYAREQKEAGADLRFNMTNVMTKTELHLEIIKFAKDMGDWQYIIQLGQEIFPQQHYYNTVIFGEYCFALNREGRFENIIDHYKNDSKAKKKFFFDPSCGLVFQLMLAVIQKKDLLLAKKILADFQTEEEECDNPENKLKLTANRKCAEHMLFTMMCFSSAKADPEKHAKAIELYCAELSEKTPISYVIYALFLLHQKTPSSYSNLKKIYHQAEKDKILTPNLVGIYMLCLSHEESTLLKNAYKSALNNKVCCLVHESISERFFKKNNLMSSQGYSTWSEFLETKRNSLTQNADDNILKKLMGELLSSENFALEDYIPLIAESISNTFIKDANMQHALPESEYHMDIDKDYPAVQTSTTPTKKTPDAPPQSANQHLQNTYLSTKAHFSSSLCSSSSSTSSSFSSSHSSQGNDSNMMDQDDFNELLSQYIGIPEPKENTEPSISTQTTVTTPIQQTEITTPTPVIYRKMENSATLFFGESQQNTKASLVSSANPFNTFTDNKL